MTRRSIFAWLFGGAAASAEKFQVICRDKDGPHFCDIRNNQCPVCGEMAAPYRPDTHFCGDIVGGQSLGISGTYGCEGRLNIVRCKRCNAAFWQDAVK